MPKMYIPEIGDLLKLTTAWHFTLHKERRNDDVWEALDCDSHPSLLPITQERDRLHKEIGEIRDRMTMRHYGSGPFRGSRMVFASSQDDTDFHAAQERLIELHHPTCPVEFPRKTVLRVDRIYIRKGNEDFSSVSFFVAGSPLPALQPTEFKKKVGSRGRRRFWAKLVDVNTMQFDQVEQP